VTLHELCEPFFLYICRLNRIARNQGTVDYLTLRGDIKELLEEAKVKARQDPKLDKQFEAIYLPLIFFIDSMIFDSGINCAQEWDENRLAYDHNELAGDEAFFDYLESTQEDKSDDASERLLFYYTALGLGFTGMYMTDTAYLQSEVNKMLPRVKPYMQTDQNKPICSEAYDHTDTSNLIEPPGNKIIGMVIAFVGMLVVSLALVVYLYYAATNEMNQAVDTIIQNGTPDED